MNAVPDQFIRQLSGAALLLDDPKTELDTLTCIPGIGNATATLVLAFYDPANYAIGDRYIVDALLGEGHGMRLTDYPKILKELLIEILVDSIFGPLRGHTIRNIGTSRT
ncbi:hypothetical protein [Natrarchaeobius chitinivorans]|uniref:hypothetical protein n=1 Tax=Natrarchaeobius chitinivorans TaxID=1679083 RepID=UPI001A9E29E6|nr:hypothetical protein [Natrarchaeobius chitinivorans]